MFGFKKRRDAKRKQLCRDVALEVISQLENKRGWKKFLPPVVLRDRIYMVTEDGSIYALSLDVHNEMEMIIQIRN